MGVDTKALLTSAPDVLDMLKWATETYTRANLSYALGPADFYWLNFKDGDHERNVAVFPPGVCASDYADIHKGPAVLISMGCWGNSVAIARRMAVKWGGLVLPNDCSDDWQHVA